MDTPPPLPLGAQAALPSLAHSFIPTVVPSTDGAGTALGRSCGGCREWTGMGQAPRLEGELGRKVTAASSLHPSRHSGPCCCTSVPVGKLRLSRCPGLRSQSRLWAWPAPQVRSGKHVLFNGRWCLVTASPCGARASCPQGPSAPQSILRLAGPGPLSRGTCTRGDLRLKPCGSGSPGWPLVARPHGQGLPSTHHHRPRECPQLLYGLLSPEALEPLVPTPRLCVPWGPRLGGLSAGRVAGTGTETAPSVRRVQEAGMEDLGLSAELMSGPGGSPSKSDALPPTQPHHRE